MASVILPTTPQCARAVVQGTYNGIKWVNGFNLQYSGAALALSDLNALAQAVEAAYKASFQSRMNSAAAYIQTVTYDLSTRSTAQGIANTGWTGTHGTTQPAANNVAACISWKINLRYRGGHPRSYITGCNMDEIGSGHTWIGSGLTGYQAAGTSFLTAMNGITAGARIWFMGSIKYFQHGQVLGSGQFYAIQQALFHSRVDSMRRRLGKETI